MNNCNCGNTNIRDNEAYFDFLKHMKSANIKEEEINNLAEYGISWCESGETKNDKKTTMCAECKYLKECDVIYDIMQVD